MSENREPIETIYGPFPFAELSKHWHLIERLEEEAKGHAIRRIGVLPTFPPVGPSSFGSVSAQIQYEAFCRTIGIDIQPQQSDNSPTPTIEGEQNAVSVIRSIQ